AGRDPTERWTLTTSENFRENVAIDSHGHSLSHSFVVKRLFLYIECQIVVAQQWVVAVFRGMLVTLHVGGREAAVVHEIQLVIFVECKRRCLLRNHEHFDLL